MPIKAIELFEVTDKDGSCIGFFVNKARAEIRQAEIEGSHISSIVLPLSKEELKTLSELLKK